MGKKLLLYCQTRDSTFTLAEEGNEERQVFTDLRAALQYASSNVDEDTPLLVFNEMGKLVIESTIMPKFLVQD